MAQIFISPSLNSLLVLSKGKAYRFKLATLMVKYTLNRSLFETLLKEGYTCDATEDRMIEILTSIDIEKIYEI